MTRTATTTDAPAAPAVPDIADDLADLLRTGRMCGPTAVVRVAYTLADGRLVAVDLPAPRVTAGEDREDDGDPPLSALEQGIVDVLRRHPGRRMSAAEIAPLVDEDEDPYAGTFKRAVSRLKLLGVIEGGKSEGGYRLKTPGK